MGGTVFPKRHRKKVRAIARPAKAIAVSARNNTKEDIALRSEIESRLKGTGLPECPDWLTDKQKEIFDTVVEHCASAGILSSVDGNALAQFSVAVDRLQTIETLVNQDTDLLFDQKLMSTRSNYERTLWRGCNEFCLSPQARAKIGSLAVGKMHDAEDPLAAALSGGAS